LSYNILVQIEALLAGHARSHGIAHELVVLPHDSNVLHSLVNNGRKGFSQLAGALAFEVFRCSGVAAGEDLAGIRERHSGYSVDENLFRCGSGLLSSAIHAYFECIDLRSHADQPQATANVAEFLWQQNPDCFILKKAIDASCGSYSVFRAYGQGFFEAGNDFVV